MVVFVQPKEEENKTSSWDLGVFLCEVGSFNRCHFVHNILKQVNPIASTSKLNHKGKKITHTKHHHIVASIG